MNFYKDFLYIHLSFLIIYLPLTRTVGNRNLNVIKSGQAPVNPCSIGINLFTILNNTSESDYFVELLPDECCIDTDGTLDCDSLKIIGECVDVLPKGQSKSLHLVAPTVNPLERKGFCTIHVDSRPVDRKSNVMRDTIKIKFDTTIRNNENLKTITPCTHVDEDPLNECKPVNCEPYYNGLKNYFDKHKKRCVSPRVCVDDERYDDNDNDCITSDAITEADLDFLRSLVVHGRPHKSLLIIKKIKNKSPNKINCTKVSDKNVEEEKDSNENDVEPKTKCELKTVKAKKCNDTCVESDCIKVFSSYFGKASTNIKLYFCKAVSIVKNNKYTILVLASIVLLQCTILMAIVYYTKLCKDCGKKKKVKCKFFNYRQDASITTPLIGTSNIDTETTEFNYVSESSYIDNKIKCYKACQKQPNDAKISMSDDILTKYLNKRDWNTKLNSKTVQNKKHNNLKSDSKGDFKATNDFKVDRKDTKQFDVETKREQTDNKKTARVREQDAESCRSEREIQCHDYNMKIDQNKRLKETVSLSTEKGAQACFSNDSVDDFLSEKGIYIFGENLSKYSVNTSSPARSSYTETSSKTSKNNIVRHLMSFLSRKSKTAVKSEPGKSSSRDKLELLHISKASLQSSSDLNVKKLTSSKFFKESRSTF